MAEYDALPVQSGGAASPSETTGSSPSAMSASFGKPSPTRAHWWTPETLRWIFASLLIPLAGFVWNEVQKRDAVRQERIIDARSESDIVIRLMPALAADEGSPTRGIAFAILMNLSNREALSPELASAVQVAVDNAQQRVREGTATPAEREALSRIAAATDDLPPQRLEAILPAGAAPGAERATAARTLQVDVPRVYIHIFDEVQRPAAEELTRWITVERNWLAPGIENVTATAARAGRTRPNGGRTAEVRFFNEEDRGYAQDISARLGTDGTTSVERKVENLKAPSGQIEVWFPVS